MCLCSLSEMVVYTSSVVELVEYIYVLSLNFCWCEDNECVTDCKEDVLSLQVKRDIV